MKCVERIWIASAIFLLILILWSAATLHWHYVMALVAATVFLAAANIVFMILEKDIPDENNQIALRDALWNRSIGANFPFWPESNNIIDRKPAEAERLIAYLDCALDRQIAQARGILTFNTLLMVLMVIEKTRLPAAIKWDDSIGDVTQFAIFAVITGLAASSFFCAQLFWVRWEKPETYATFPAEFANSLATLRKRAHSLANAIVISVLATLVAIAVIFFAGLTAS